MNQGAQLRLLRMTGQRSCHGFLHSDCTKRNSLGAELCSFHPNGLIPYLRVHLYHTSLLLVWWFNNWNVGIQLKIVACNRDLCPGVFIFLGFPRDYKEDEDGKAAAAAWNAEGWIKGPDMLNDRCSCKAVAVESKIYVFGGNNKTVEDNNSTTRPWAEFLDPEKNKNKWEPLPALPDDSLIHDLVYNPVVYGGPGEGKKIILSCCGYIYLVDAQTWEKFCPPASMSPFNDNMISDGNIHSFDMKTQDVDCGIVEGYRLSKYPEELLPEPTLLHLEGDYFCFITVQDLPEGRTKVRCTKFQISRQGGFKASVVCRNTCIIDCPVDIDCGYAFVL
ncbi:hypothetical protein C3L33_17804, partial [Rhododendron williamsianum]